MGDINMNLQIFTKWHEHSSVRNSPRRVLDDKSASHYFSPAVAPILSHPAISTLSSARLMEAEVQLLYKYLKFTEYLETRQVNKVILSISTDEYNLDFPDCLKEQAYKIYCDEAYHALQATDMAAQILSVTGIKSLDFEIELESRLEQIESSFPTELKLYFDLFFVAIAENLVSQELNGCVKDKAIHPEISNLLCDHAKDEVAHAIFFRQVLQHLHKGLGAGRFKILADYLPAFLYAYLVPSRTNLEMIFNPHMKREVCEALMNDWYQPENIDAIVTQSSVSLRKVIVQLIND
jgi:hypothetical protein